MNSLKCRKNDEKIGLYRLYMVLLNLLLMLISASCFGCQKPEMIQNQLCQSKIHQWGLTGSPAYTYPLTDPKGLRIRKEKRNDSAPTPQDIRGDTS